MKGIRLMILELSDSSAGIRLVQLRMMYLLQKNARNKQPVNIGMARGMRLAYMQHMKNCKHITASSVGRSIGNMHTSQSASFWMVGFSGSLFQHFERSLHNTKRRLMVQTTIQIKGLMLAMMKKLVQQGEITANQSRSKSLKIDTFSRLMKSINLRQLTLLNPNISPFKTKGKMVLFTKLDKKTLMKMKLYSFGFVSGFSSLPAIVLTTTIKMMLVTVDSTDAPICTMFEIKILCQRPWHKLATPSSVQIEAQLAEQKQQIVNLSPELVAWANVVSPSNEPQFELVETYNVQRVIKEDVIKMLMAMKRMEKQNLNAQEPEEMSTLSQLMVSGLDKLTDSIIKSSLWLNLSFSGSPGIQQMHLLKEAHSLFTSPYFLHTFMKAYLAFKFRKWMIAQIGSK